MLGKLQLIKHTLQFRAIKRNKNANIFLDTKRFVESLTESYIDYSTNVDTNSTKSMISH